MRPSRLELMDDYSVIKHVLSYPAGLAASSTGITRVVDRTVSGAKRSTGDQLLSRAGMKGANETYSLCQSFVGIGDLFDPRASSGAGWQWMAATDRSCVVIHKIPKGKLTTTPRARLVISKVYDVIFKNERTYVYTRPG